MFKRVSGEQINNTDFCDTILYSYGKALERLHLLSSRYTPDNTQRWSYSDVLDCIHDKLIDIPDEAAALMKRNYYEIILHRSPNRKVIMD